MFVTESPFKGDIAHALSGRIFVCVPGVNQYANLPVFSEELKGLGTEYIKEKIPSYFYFLHKCVKYFCRKWQKYLVG